MCVFESIFLSDLGLRGCTADVIIMEEAAHMSPAVFKQVISPLIGVKGTAVLAISTPDDEFNYYTELMELKGNAAGDNLFYCIKIGLQCDLCLANGVSCLHGLRKLPHWKSVGRQQKVSAMLAGDKELDMRENFGVVVSNKQFAFAKDLLAALKAAAPHEFREAVQVMHIGIDPSGGGAGSDYSMVTCAVEDGKQVICGLDSTASTVHRDVMRMLTDHIEAIQRHEKYQYAQIFVYIEANMSYLSADAVRDRLSAYPRVTCVREDANVKLDRVGVWTGKYEKENYAYNLQRLLQDNQLFFAVDLIGRHPAMDVAALFDQLAVFRREVKERPDLVFTKLHAEWTGKSHGRKDDLALALQICLYWLMRQRCKPEFRDIAKEYGWAQY